MIDPLTEVLGRLRSRGIEPRRSGKGWSARCPAHDDRSPSLSIACGDDGRVLVHCHAGCRFAEVARALGMAPKELFAANSLAAAPRRRSRSLPRSLRRAARTAGTRPAPRSFASWETAIGRFFAPPTATWFYRDASGRLVGVVARFRDGDSGKTFRQASLGENGGWHATGMPAPRPLYRLPELLTSQGTVYVVEGEKCADALAQLGVVSITSIGGATNAHHSDWTPLAGRRVVIVPDNDTQGARYASDVAALARRAGAGEVCLVSMAMIWPEVPPKGDVADWVAAYSHEPAQLLRDVLERRATDAISSGLKV